MDNPEFSLIIINHNYGCYLDQCIQSCLSQSFPSKELIVVDDGSTDHSTEILLSYGKKIKALTQKNSGQSSAINLGYQASQGKWIWFLDADDYLLPHALQLVADVAIKEKPALIFGQALRVDSKGKALPSRKQRPEPVRRGVLWPEIIYEGSARLPPASCLIFQRIVLEKILPVPKQRIPIASDDYLRRRSLFYGNGWGLKENIIAYRQHSRNYSRLYTRAWISIKKNWTQQAWTYHYVRMEALRLKHPYPASRRKLEIAHALIYIAICQERGRHQNQALADLKESFKNDHSLLIWKKIAYLLSGYLVWLFPASWGRALILLIERYKSFQIGW
jgi:glycosyltransferase involved in cell wall biosynthesis